MRAVSGGAGSAAEIEELSERILSYGAPDVFIMALGSPADEMSAEESSSVLAEKLWVNASAPVIFLEIFFRRMREAGGGRMALFGSVAGDRIRRGNYTYGAAKSLVASYAEGFSEKARGSGVTLTLIKPGPADTPGARSPPRESRKALPCRSGVRRPPRRPGCPPGQADGLRAVLVAASHGSRAAHSRPAALAFFPSSLIFCRAPACGIFDYFLTVMSFLRTAAVMSLF